MLPPPVGCGQPTKWLGVGYSHDTSWTLFRCATSALSRVVAEEAPADAIPARSDDEGQIALVFMVPGPVAPPNEFVGIRTDRYLKEHRAKQLQVAVPPDLATREQLRAFLIEVLHDAPAIAAKALARQRVATSLECAAEAAARVAGRVDEVVDEAWAAYERRPH